MTTPSELADELATISVVNTYTAREQLAAIMLANLPEILSALRRVEKMEGIVELARELINTGLVNRDVDRGLVVVERPDRSDPHYLLCVALERFPARQALTGEA